MRPGGKAASVKGPTGNLTSKVVRLINKAKASYYLKSLMDADCKMTFQIISGLLGKGNASNHTLMEVKQQAVSFSASFIEKSRQDSP